jgi:Cu-Zn family superoxide dismutase
LRGDGLSGGAAGGGVAPGELTRFTGDAGGRTVDVVVSGLHLGTERALEPVRRKEVGMRALALLMAIGAAVVLGRADRPAAAPAAKKAAPAKNEAAEVAVANLKNAKGESIGAAVLRETPAGVLLAVKLSGLPPGAHGFHIHEHGACEPPFQSAGGHFNPTKKHHGYAAADGYHAGDMPNLFVGSDGQVSAEFLVPGVTLVAGKPNSLLDSDGSSLVVHAGTDDYRSDPAGASGDRIACGTIERPKAPANAPGGSTKGTR